MQLISSWPERRGDEPTGDASSAAGRPPTATEAAPPRVILLADVRLYREGLVRALEDSPHLRIVGAAPVGISSLEVLAQARPDIVLLEAQSARVAAVVQAILAAAPGAKVIAFAVTDEEDDAVRCAEAGASGYVSREATLEELAGTVQRVALGEFPCSPRVAALLARRISSLAAERAPAGLASGLTKRQREIVRLIDDGLSNKEIARRLGIEVCTVKNHVHQILDRTSSSRRAQAAARTRTPWPRAGV
jgi:two-component system, NarL family, nitrate/nitrite response regulator NarL